MSEGKAIQPHLGQNFYPLLFFFVSYLLLHLCPFFSNHLFLNLIFSSNFITTTTLTGATLRIFFPYSTQVVLAIKAALTQGFRLVTQT